MTDTTPAAVVRFDQFDASSEYARMYEKHDGYWVRHSDYVDIKDELKMLSDPNAVHINMIRGTIAKPTVEQIIHLYGADILRAALIPADLPPTPEKLMADPRVQALVKALVKSAEGWANAIEMGLLPRQHFTSARILRDEARAAIAQLKEPKT